METRKLWATATGAICDVMGCNVKPSPAVASADVSRIGTSPALM